MQIDDNDDLYSDDTENNSNDIENNSFYQFDKQTKTYKPATVAPELIALIRRLRSFRFSIVNYQQDGYVRVFYSLRIENSKAVLCKSGFILISTVPRAQALRCETKRRSALLVLGHLGQRASEITDFDQQFLSRSRKNKFFLTVQAILSQSREVSRRPLPGSAPNLQNQHSEKSALINKLRALRVLVGSRGFRFAAPPFFLSVASSESKTAPRGFAPAHELKNTRCASCFLRSAAPQNFSFVAKA
ncbi:UNKNOWN [Stylonychia lemnae]|uniref:Uncharacterized protein n=1 Tax=Stylonychia lemnae TaxID=5949 RepID=A0A077ZVE2_STYLE|nr:UNKNOWN [Stylonychia lemnae]|eukprot:CDW72391.1 UNKNOWN [Stylonychia lemnae]